MNKLFFALFLSLQSHLAISAEVPSAWHAGIADPTVLGWFTVSICFVAVVRCMQKSKESKYFGGNHQFWLYLTVFLLLLGINKQLDFHTRFAEIMRDSARTYGWYGYRQSMFAVCVSILGVGILLAMLRFRLYVASSWRNYKIAWAGILLLLMLVLIQMSSDRDADILIKQQVFGFAIGLSISTIIEISALLLIILGTYFNKNNIISLTEAITLTIKDYVETSKEDNPVQCPQCGVQPLSKPKDGRVFKCRACGFQYSVRVVD